MNEHVNTSRGREVLDDLNGPSKSTKESSKRSSWSSGSYTKHYGNEKAMYAMVDCHIERKSKLEDSSNKGLEAHAMQTL